MPAPRLPHSIECAAPSALAELLERSALANRPNGAGGRPWRFILLGWLTIVLAASFVSQAKALAGSTPPPIAGTITGFVKDALGRPLPHALVRLLDDHARTLAITHTDSAGRFFFAANPHHHPARIAASAPGYTTSLIATASSAALVIPLSSEKPLTLPVSASRAQTPRNAPSAAGTSTYRFDSAAISDLPAGENSSLRQVLIQAPGVSPDAYGQGQGQIHVHGENGGGIQYRINGVYIPDAVNNFGEVISPRFLQSVDLLTGFMPAQYGYRNEAVLDLRTRSGCEDPGGSLNLYGGQRGTLEPSFDYGGCYDKLSYYFSGLYLGDDLGVQPATSTPTPLHDNTNQGQFFGYLSYPVGSSARLSLVVGGADNYFQIPPNPHVSPLFTLAAVPSYPANAVAESQFEQSYYGVLSLDGKLGPAFLYQVSYFSRYYQLNFFPDPVGDLIYNGTAASLLDSGYLNGLQTDTTYQLTPHHTIQTGFYLSGETIELDDHAQVFPADSAGNQTGTVPIAVVDNHHTLAMLYGLYLQDQWRPTARLTLTLGARLDLMDALVTQWQFSPRLGALYELDPQTQLHAGYARYFQVPPFDAVQLQTLSKFAGTTGEPAVTQGNQKIPAETDDFFDVGLARRLPLNLALSLDSYFLVAQHKLDLAQLGSTYITAPLSYRQGRGWGTDLSLVEEHASYSAYLNFSYAVLQAKDITAGQFLADDPATVAYVQHHWINLDDDQMFTASAGGNYRWRGFLLSFDAIGGSGYRAGFANTATLPPIWQINAALGHGFHVPELGVLDGRLVLVNVFDHPYELRNGTGIGVFSPQWGPRRALYAGLSVPLPAVGGRN